MNFPPPPVFSSNIQIPTNLPPLPTVGVFPPPLVNTPPPPPITNLPPPPGHHVASSTNSGGHDPMQDFILLERLGKGSFGAVYKAKHKSTNLIVAIKKMAIADMEDNLSEIEIMKECDNTHIIKYFGNYIHDEHIWIVMEYCALGALNDAMRLAGRKTLSEKEIASISRNVLNGLIYLHATNKIHRDIKPDNILLNQQGEPKLADFGVAGKVSTLERRQTLTGTPYYIAPEILKDEGPGYDSKADIWSFGASIMEIAQGEPPYGDAPPMRVMMLIAKNPAPTLKHPNQFSKEFVDFLATCLVKEPKQRPAAKELIYHKFLQNAEPPAVVMAEFASQVTDIMFKAGGYEAAMRQLKDANRSSVDRESYSSTSKDKMHDTIEQSRLQSGSPPTAQQESQGKASPRVVSSNYGNGSTMMDRLLGRERANTDNSVLSPPVSISPTNSSSTLTTSSPAPLTKKEQKEKEKEQKEKEKKEKENKKKLEEKEKKDKKEREKREKEEKEKEEKRKKEEKLNKRKSKDMSTSKEIHKKDSPPSSPQISSTPPHTQHVVLTQSQHDSYNLDGTMEKTNIKKKLTRFFTSGNRPSKEDLVKRNIIDQIYDEDFGKVHKK